MIPRFNTPHRTVIDLVTGHFHERRGYSIWRENGTGDWLIIYTVGGMGRFGHAGGEILASAGDVVILRPKTLHDYGVEKTLRKWELLWAHFQPRPHWIEWLGWPEVSPGLMRVRLDTGTRGAVKRELRTMHAAATGAARSRTALAMCALERAILLCDAANPLAGQSSLDPRVQAAMEYLCRNLAGQVHLSASRLAHLFRAQTGTTPQQFLEVQRLDRAKQLLALTPHSIKEVAHLVGFANPFYFTMRFKRYTGQSPRAWRRG